MDVTEAFIEAAFRGAPEAVAQLVTLSSDALSESLRVTDWPGGIVAAGEDYVHYPFQLKWAGASQESPFGSAQLTIANVDRQIEEACDAALEPPRVDMVLVKVSDPNVMEAAMLDARLSLVQGDAQKVTGTINPRDFTREPACSKNYTPSTAAGLF